ncbi:uncharacterized protein LOC119391038 isoform X2 [Rhipicephalus sanguineus]|uniref:uncharacterized protein LOC119391038 isoform X2 n=1 Tax=Rhipicephalus sanguineus TaxID=34632 RepID=UPI0020C2DC77|nr:uncharacterized protein LOC119391038 isoform X2 [Rhipicephalus sanguineus]
MAPWSIIMVMALLSTALTAEDCFSSGSRSDCNTKVHELEEDAKQAFESTMVSCLKEVKGDTQDVDQLKQAVCATPVLKRKQNTQGGCSLSWYTVRAGILARRSF